jgi:hypothetical protein
MLKETLIGAYTADRKMKEAPEPEVAEGTKKSPFERLNYSVLRQILLGLVLPAHLV